MTQDQLEGLFFPAAFTACIPTANWLIGNAGSPGVPVLPAVAWLRRRDARRVSSNVAVGA